MKKEIEVNAENIIKLFKKTIRMLDKNPIPAKDRMFYDCERGEWRELNKANLKK